VSPAAAPGKPLTPGVLERDAVGTTLLAVRREARPVSVALGPRELKVLAGFKDWPLREAEWRAGRHVAKQVLLQGFGISPGEVEILPAESGAPVLYVRGAVPAALCLSVSHTTHWAVAVVAPFAVGIDVAEDEDGSRLPRIARRVFSEGEAEACGAHLSVATQAAVWALKEAGLKLHLGGVFSPGARSIRVLSLNPPQLADPRLEVALFRLDDAAVAIARDRAS
jgi:phosphopantetheinyl transferase (holo-ACP synthase)